MHMLIEYNNHHLLVVLVFGLGSGGGAQPALRLRLSPQCNYNFRGGWLCVAVE